MDRIKKTSAKNSTRTILINANSKKSKEGVDERALREEFAAGYLEMAELNRGLSHEDTNNIEKEVGSYEEFLMNCENYFEFDKN